MNPLAAVLSLYHYLNTDPGRPARRPLYIHWDDAADHTDDLTRNPTMTSDFDFQVAPYMFTPDFIEEERRLTARQPRATTVSITRRDWYERFDEHGRLRERGGSTTVFERVERF
jgi:hypothetical protein